MKIGVKIFFFSAVLFYTCIATNVIAQVQPTFMQILEDKGLQSNTIYNTHIAKNGLLYIAHSKGLSSFDGVQFVNYNNVDFPFTEMTNILETDDGTIYCKSFNNTIYKVENGELRHGLTVFNNNVGFSPSACYKQNIYSYKKDSLIVFNTKKNVASTIRLATTKASNNIGKPVFIGSLMLENKIQVVLLDEHLNFSILPLQNNFFGKFHFSNGDVFFVNRQNSNEILCYNTKQTLSLPTNNFNYTINYITTTDSLIWVCTSNGVFYKNKNNNKEPFTKIFSGYNITSVVQTSNNGFFISTIGHGLLYVPNFNVLSHSKFQFTCNYFFENNNYLLLGNNAGQVINYSIQQAKSIYTQTFSNVLNVSFILKDKYSNSLIVSGKSTTINKTVGNFIVKDYCYIDSNIVLATNNGVYVYTAFAKPHWLQKYKIFDNFNSNHLYKVSFSNEHTSNIKYNASTSTIYIGNYSGLFKISKNEDDVTAVPEPFCALKDICIYNNQLLLASKDKGILALNGNKYLPAFPNNPTDGILYKFEIYKDELWVLGEDAIFYYKNNTLHRFAEQVGIKAKAVKQISITENKVYLNNGEFITEFSKQLITNQPTQFGFILNKVINVKQNSLVQNEAKLASTSNVINFNFSVINYSDPTNVHIAYSVNNQELIHLAYTVRELPLNLLKPDNYNIQFYVVTKNAAPKLVHQFKFTITPPWYNTWWFLLLALAVFIASLYLIFLSRYKKAKEKLALKESKILLERELHKSTLAGIRAQMNPHFIFNALNTIQSYVYMNDKRNASIYISKFSDLTRSILDMSHKEKVSLTEELNALETYLSLEKMRFEESFEYKIHVHDALYNETIFIPPMMLQPYVENAIKHGLLHRKNNRVLTVDFNKVNGFLKISIDDNGIGRQKSEELNKISKKSHTSFSTEANKKRIDILKQQFPEISIQIVDKISSYGEAEGTTVILQLPL